MYYFVHIDLTFILAFRKLALFCATDIATEATENAEKQSIVNNQLQEALTYTSTLDVPCSVLDIQILLTL